MNAQTKGTSVGLDLEIALYWTILPKYMSYPLNVYWKCFRRSQDWFIHLIFIFQNINLSSFHDPICCSSNYADLLFSTNLTSVDLSLLKEILPAICHKLTAQKSRSLYYPNLSKWAVPDLIPNLIIFCWTLHSLSYIRLKIHPAIQYNTICIDQAFKK